MLVVDIQDLTKVATDGLGFIERNGWFGVAVIALAALGFAIWRIWQWAWKGALYLGVLIRDFLAKLEAMLTSMGSGQQHMAALLEQLIVESKQARVLGDSQERHMNAWGHPDWLKGRLDVLQQSLAQIQSEVSTVRSQHATLADERDARAEVLRKIQDELIQARKQLAELRNAS